MGKGDITIDDLLCNKTLRKQRDAIWTDVRSAGIAVIVPLVGVWYWIATELAKHSASRIEAMVPRSRGVWFQELFVLGANLVRTNLTPFAAVLGSVRDFVLDPSVGQIGMLNHAFILVSGCVVACASVLCASAYLTFRVQNLPFRYVLDQVQSTASRPLGRCISETITQKHESGGMRCNPGLSRTRRGHLYSVLAMLRNMADATECKPSRGLTALEDAKAHVQIAAMRISNQRELWLWVYGVASVVVAILVYVAMAYASLLGYHILSIRGPGTRAVLIATLMISIMLVTLLGTTANVAIKRQSLLTHKSTERFMRIYRALGECEHTGRRTIPSGQHRALISGALGKLDASNLGEAGSGPDGDSGSLQSPRLLAAAFVVAAITVAVVLLQKTGVARVATGLRMLHSGATTRAMYSGGGTAVNTALDYAEAHVGNRVAVAHVVGWSVATMGLCGIVTGRSLVELGRSTGQVKFEDDDEVPSEARPSENER